MVAATACFLSAPVRPPSVVVPGMIATRLPPSVEMPRMREASVTSKLPPSMKVRRLKSTCSWRDSEAVVEPHSMSIVPSATDRIRFSTVTLTHFT